MKQECTDRMAAYHTQEFQKFLKEKNVLDAYQFLHSSSLYLNYALISEQMYRDAVGQNFSQNNRNPFDPTVTVLGFRYNIYKLLNKFTLEWVSHVSNAVDMLLQYINSALHLRLAYADVKISNVINAIQSHQALLDAFSRLIHDDTVAYIRAVYNYSKHTLNLYGGSNFFAALNGDRYINIPEFRYRGKEYPSRCISTLFDRYESFVDKYLAVLDCVYSLLNDTPPVPNRYHIGSIVVDGNVCNATDILFDSDISLYDETDPNSQLVTKVWVENILLSAGDHIEIFPANHTRTGQSIKHIDLIDVLNGGKKVGTLKLCSADVHKPQKQKNISTKHQPVLETSALSYHCYSFEPE